MDLKQKNEMEILRSRDESEGKRYWDIEKNEKFGRYLVAAKDIAQGEIILTEKPLAWGPYTTNSVLVCVGCYRHINGDTKAAGCSRCHLPICSQKCQNNEKHQNQECSAFQKFKSNFNFRNDNGEYVIEKIPYSVILIVRILMMKTNSPENWKIFNVLDPLLDEWKAMGSWEQDQEDILNTIITSLGLDIFKKEEILKVIAICCTNTFSKFLEPDNEGPANKENVTVGTFM